jgi:hypothetical protein
MGTRRIFWLLSLTLAFILLGSFPGWGGPLDRRQPQPERRGPVITHAFAVEKGYYGYVWKIYLEADDPDGQMLKIASVVDEAGHGQYPTDWIYLKPEFQKHLNVSVVDKAGNESNQVVFPFTFEITPGQYSDKAPAPFDQGSIPLLGHITVDLYSPGQGYGHDGKKD